MLTIPAKDTTRRYELTYLVPASLTEAETQSVKDEIAAVVKKHSGKIIEAADWGKRPMAYGIKKNKVAHREARYVHTIVEMPAESTAEVNRAMHLNGQVLRHLLVLAEEIIEFTPTSEVEETELPLE